MNTTNVLSSLRYVTDPPIGARLIEDSRTLLGLTNAELAESLGCTPSYTTKLRRGDKLITPAILARIGLLLIQKFGDAPPTGGRKLRTLQI